MANGGNPMSAPGSRRTTELNEFLGVLAEKGRDMASTRAATMASQVEGLAKEQQRAWLNDAGIQLRWLISLWNSLLYRSLEQSVPPERVLCAFNVVVDVVIHLDEAECERLLERLAAALPAESGDVCGTVAEWERSPAAGPADSLADRLSKQVTTPIEFLAALTNAIKQPGKEWKPRLHESLWGLVREYAYSRKSPPVGADADEPRRFRMGGASGNMAYALHALGLNVAVHWPYHAKEIAEDVAASPDIRGLMRVLFEDGKKVERPAAQDGPNGTAAGACPNDPVRRSFVFEFSPPSIDDPGKGTCLCGKEARDTGRVIFLAPPYLSDDRRWTRVVLRIPRVDAEPATCEIPERYLETLSSHEWPFLPVFSWKRMEQCGKEQVLVIEIADDRLMTEVANSFKYLVLGGIHAIEHLPGDVKQAVKHALGRQLDTLAGQRTVAHWEIGGIKSPALLEELAEVVCGRVPSASLNPDELDLITRQESYAHTRFHCPTTAEREGWPVLARFDRAVHLARELSLDHLYVHGNDVDLIIRRGASPGALRQELAAILFAKGDVLLTLLKRSVPKWQDHVRDVSPELTADGFRGLLDLAHGLALRRFPMDAELDRHCPERQDGRRSMFENIVQSGYLYERDPEDYSVIVVPVMWPRLDIPFSTAGAGDTTSAVVAVYSGI